MAQTRLFRRTGLVLVLGMLLILTLGLFALACGSGNEETTTTAAPATSSTVAPTTSSTAAPETSTTAAPSTTTTVAKSDLILATTTSTKDSGLLDVLVPDFNKAYPQYNVKVVAVGSGEALKMGETGDADVLLVHSPAAEQTFMDNGFGIERKAVMYNDFIVVGPPADPAKIKGLTSSADAFKMIAATKAPFFTRNDNSGTYTKELSLWKAAGITPSGAWYQSTGQGMGETLTIADQKSGYTLSDRATYLSKKSSLALVILVEGDKALFNQYHVINVKQAKNAQGALDFLNWIISPTVQNDIIAKFGADTFGQPLFIPNAATAQ